MLCDIKLNQCLFKDWYPSHIQFDLTEFNPDNNATFTLVSNMLYNEVNNTGKIFAIAYPFTVFDILMEINRQGIEGTVLVGYMLNHCGDQWNYLPQVALVTKTCIYKILETTFKDESSINYQFYDGDASTFEFSGNIDNLVRFNWGSMR